MSELKNIALKVGGVDRTFGTRKIMIKDTNGQLTRWIPEPAVIGDQCRVAFVDSDRETILDVVTVEKGGGAIYHGTNPTTPGMTFIGWSPEPVNVQKDMYCFPRFENTIYYDGQINDDWITIARNVRENPNYYPIGAWKLLNLGTLAYADMDQNTKDILWEWDGGGQNTFSQPSFVAMQLAGIKVDPLEGGNGYANTSWIPKSIWCGSGGVSGYSIQLNTDYIRPDWTSCKVRKFFQEQFAEDLFPQDLLPYVRPVVKYSSVYVNDSKYTTSSVDKFWLASGREVFGYASNYGDLGLETTGARYLQDSTPYYDGSTIRSLSTLGGAIPSGNDHIILRSMGSQWDEAVWQYDGACSWQGQGGRNAAFGFCL